MTTVKQTVWRMRKRLLRQMKVLRGVPRAAGMVPLSIEGARAAYGGRDDVTITPFVRKIHREFAPAGCLEEDRIFPVQLSEFPKTAPDYEAVLLEARSSDFTFRHHHLLDDQQRVIYEPKMRFEQLPIKDVFLEETRKLDGTVAYLGNTMFCQYAHWMQKQLPMLLAYWEQFGQDTIDYYYIGAGEIKNFAKESLLKLGVREEQIVGFACRGDRALICVDARPAVSIGMRMDSASYDFLKTNLFQAGAPVAGKRLFVIRGEVSGRKELNLPEVKQALEPLGFEFVETAGRTMQEEADLFGNADVIIAVHGAALHNLLFARPGTKVIEIFPYDYFEESNYVIANHGGCDYSYLIGSKVSEMDAGASLLERNRADVIIDTDKLLRLCNEVGVNP